MNFHSDFVCATTSSQRSTSSIRRSVSSLVVAIGLSIPMLTLAQGAPVCDGRIFLSQGSDSTLNAVSTDANPMTFTTIGSSAGITFNALGYSPSDGQLYAMRTDGSGNHLMTLDQTTGVVTDQGVVTGLPVSPVYNTGAVGSNGVYYVKPLGSTQMIYAINTTTKTATAINLSQAFMASDMAWVGGATGGLYSVADSGQLFSINVTNSSVGALGSPDTTGGVLGAQFGGTNGLFGSANDGSGFYQVDLTTGKKTKISDSPGSGNNDGANCPNAAIKFPADVGITKTNDQTNYTPGTNVVYTITVSNKGPFTATGAKVTDGLPNGVSTANWSCSASAGSFCTASGTGGIDDTVTLRKDGTATYILTLNVPVGFLGSLVNTATVEADGISMNAINVNPDPDPSNDIATDTDTPSDVLPVKPQVAPVPSLGEWALMLLSLMLAGFAVLKLRRAHRI